MILSFIKIAHAKFSLLTLKLEYVLVVVCCCFIFKMYLLIVANLLIVETVNGRPFPVNINVV